MEARAIKLQVRLRRVGLLPVAAVTRRHLRPIHAGYRGVQWLRYSCRLQWAIELALTGICQVAEYVTMPLVGVISSLAHGRITVMIYRHGSREDAGDSLSIGKEYALSMPRVVPRLPDAAASPSSFRNASPSVTAASPSFVTAPTACQSAE